MNTKRIYCIWLATVIALTLIAGYIVLTLWAQHPQDLTGNTPNLNQVETQIEAECGRIPPVNMQERADCVLKFQQFAQQVLPATFTDSQSFAAELDR